MVSHKTENAYETYMYLRSIDKREKGIVRLLCAKSKIAPLKIIFIL